MKIEEHGLVDFKREDGLYYSIYAVKTQGLLFSHYYKLILESSNPMISDEELFEAIHEEHIDIRHISKKGKHMSLGTLYWEKYSSNDMKFYGTEYKWEECTNVALTVQSEYIGRFIRQPI